MHLICDSHRGTELSARPLKTPAYVCAYKIFSGFRHVLALFEHPGFFAMLSVIPSDFFCKSPLPCCRPPALVQSSPMTAAWNVWKGRREQFAAKPGIHAGRLGKVICSQVPGTRKCKTHKGMLPVPAGEEESLGGRSTPSAAPPTPCAVGSN